MDYIMVKEHTLGNMEVSILENTRMEKWMVKEHTLGNLMGGILGSMLEVGRIIKKMVKEQ